MRGAALLGLLAALALPVAAQTVQLGGRMGERALLVIDGQPRTVAPGQTVAGVTLLRWDGDTAVVRAGGAEQRLGAGGQPVVQGGAVVAGAREIVIPVGPGGHHIAAGAINGRPVRFMVDTGATRVAIGQDEAQRLGLDLRGAQRGLTQTANGTVPVHLLTLARVRVGEVELRQIDAVVVPAAMPYVLLGNSFLSRLQMRRDNDVLRLELR